MFACQPELLDGLLKTTACGVRVVSDYWGCGMAEIALLTIVATLQRLYDISPSWAAVARAGDIDSGCRSVLTLHGVHRPQCLLGDAMERLAHGILDHFERLWQVARARATAAAASAASKRRKVAADIAYLFFKGVVQFIFDRPDVVTAFCFEQGKSCPVEGSAPFRVGELLIAFAGFLCFDWSSIGSQKGHLGCSSCMGTVLIGILDKGTIDHAGTSVICRMHTHI